MTDDEIMEWHGATKEHPLIEGMRQAADGKWYIPDPTRPGKWLQVQHG